MMDKIIYEIKKAIYKSRAKEYIDLIELEKIKKGVKNSGIELISLFD